MKIGILGLLFEQFQQLKQRVNGGLCDLVFINKEHNPSALPPSVNYCIVQKHVSHKWFDQAQGSVGAERTFFVDGGISGVLQKVNEVIAKVH